MKLLLDWNSLIGHPISISYDGADGVQSMGANKVINIEIKYVLKTVKNPDTLFFKVAMIRRLKWLLAVNDV